MPDVAADTSTTAVFRGINGFGVKGEAYSGLLETVGDQDWVRVELIAGQSYQFAVDAHFNRFVTNFNTPMVSIRDASGVAQQVQQTLVSETVLTSFTASVSGTYFMAVEASTAVPGGSEYDAFVVGPARTTQEVNGSGATVVGAEGVFLIGGYAENVFSLGKFGLGFTGIGNDVISANEAGGVAHAGAGDDYLGGGGGVDLFWGGWGDDYLIGYASADQLFGDQGRDYLDGGVGADILSGGGDGDLLYGRDDNDTLIGGEGGDTMFGGSGSDTYYVDSSADIVDEANMTGSDTVRSSNISINLGQSAVFKGNVETAVLEGSANLNLTGNGLSNYLQGNSGANTLNGGAASDTLVGLGGNDIFRFANSIGATNIDKITDYNVSQDRIELENSYFSALPTGFLYASSFVANTTGLAQDASDRIIYESDTGKLFYDSNGTAAGGTYQQFATLTAGLSMTAGEFFVT